MARNTPTTTADGNNVLQANPPVLCADGRDATENAGRFLLNGATVSGFGWITGKYRGTFPEVEQLPSRIEQARCLPEGDSRNRGHVLRHRVGNRRHHHFAVRRLRSEGAVHQRQNARSCRRFQSRLRHAYVRALTVAGRIAAQTGIRRLNAHAI